MKTDTRHYLGWGARFRLFGRILGLTAFFAALGAVFVLAALGTDATVAGVRAGLESPGNRQIATAVLLIGFCLFAANIIGGGDAKLLAAAALWAGWTELPSLLFYTALAGGALAIVMVVWEMLRSHAELTAGASPSALLKRAISLKPDLPYGVAIAFGACAFLPRSWWAAGLL